MSSSPTMIAIHECVELEQAREWPYYRGIDLIINDHPLVRKSVGMRSSSNPSTSLLVHSLNNKTLRNPRVGTSDKPLHRSYHIFSDWILVRIRFLLYSQ